MRPPAAPARVAPRGSSDRIAEELERSAGAVRNAVESRIMSGQAMKLHYDHPLLYLQHMIWHGGYHHGQIKLALKVTSHPFDDEALVHSLGTSGWTRPGKVEAHKRNYRLDEQLGDLSSSENVAIHLISSAERLSD